MQVFNEILSSIKTNSKTRFRDPVIGTFIASWFFCNWDKVAVLFWGSKRIDERILEMTDSMSITNILTDYDLLLIPLVLSGGYLFLLPWISLWVTQKQNKAILSQHSHSVELDIKRAEEQKELNKATVIANPEKEFLAEEIKIDLQREKDKVERRNKIREYIDQKTKAAKADADTKVTLLERERAAQESKKLKEALEKGRFEAESALHKATLASNRFPAIYQLMDFLSHSLMEDDIVLSLDGLANTVAAVFGYEKAKEMLDDSRFNNNNIHEIKYLFHNHAFLAERLDDISENENSDDDDLSGELLFDHLQGVLEKYPFKFLSDDSLAEDIFERVSEHEYDILNSQELAGPIAETDTIFEEIELGVDDYKFKNGFEVSMIGGAFGNHRREPDIRGQDLSVQVMATCKPSVGRFGLADYDLQITGEPVV